MKVKIKICGIQSMEDAQNSILAGTDILGFNFIQSSSRFIGPDKAYGIISNLNSDIQIAGVFQNEKLEKVQEITDKLQLDFVQLHGEETPVYSFQIKNTNVIKVFKLFSDFDPKDVLDRMNRFNYMNHIFLLDRKIQGEGSALDPERVRFLTDYKRIFLGGGLGVHNVAEAVKKANPYGVDVAGGVETEGKKDSEKLRRFIQNVKK